MVIPTAIATDETNQDFFAHLVDENLLSSLFDFENRKGLFPDIDSRSKFSLLTIGKLQKEKETNLPDISL